MSNLIVLLVIAGLGFLFYSIVKRRTRSRFL